MVFNRTQIKSSQISQTSMSVLTKYQFQNLVLKHGVLMWPKEPEMIVIVENIWEQIQNHGVLKNDHIGKVRAKVALKSFACNYLDLDVYIR